MSSYRGVTKYNIVVKSRVRGSPGLTFKFSLSPEANIVMHIHMHGDIYFLFIAVYIHMHGDVSHYHHAYVYSILISTCIKVYLPMICQGTEIPGI